MRRFPAFLLLAAWLLYLGSCATAPSEAGAPVIASSHSVIVENGVLRVLSGDSGPLLYIYVRPEAPHRWVVAGGGGGSEPSPWRHQATMSWALADEEGWYGDDAPRRRFEFLFDSHSMTLTIERGTYAVKPGDFIVIALDDDWHPEFVKSGIDALKVFDMPDPRREQLFSAVRRHYRVVRQ